MSKKVLIIEDNNDIRENVVEILELAGYSVNEASNGKTGVELALKHKPDIILCDHSFAGGNSGSIRQNEADKQIRGCPRRANDGHPLG